MTAEVLIAVDAGTSVIKAVAFDLSGRQIAQASRRNVYRSTDGGGAVQDMARTWADTAAVLRELSDRIANLPDRAIGLGVTGQGDGTWLIDRAGQPIHDAWLWFDARAAKDAEAINASDEIDLIYETTGTGVNVCQMRSQLRCMQRTSPDVIAAAVTALHCKDWLYLNLTGARATDPTEGVFTFGDFRTGEYSDAVIDALQLTDCKRLLPPIIDGAAQTHPLSASAAAQIGLRAGLPVSLSYIDIACAGLGAGLCDPNGAVGLSVLGSTGCHMRYVPNAAGVHLNSDRSGYTLPLPKGAFAQLQTNMAATLNIDWALGLMTQMAQLSGLGSVPSDILTRLDDPVFEARSGAAIYHPYISAAGERGPFNNSNARASFTGMDTETQWVDLLRAVYDGLALAARDCYGYMGDMPSEIRATGGGARSKTLQKLIAAATRAQVRTVDQDEAGAAGAAMIAGLALGVFASTEEATKKWVHPHMSDPIAPDPSLANSFDAMFEAYVTTRHTMTPVWHAQTQMRKVML